MPIDLPWFFRNLVEMRVTTKHRYGSSDTENMCFFEKKKTISQKAKNIRYNTI